MGGTLREYPGSIRDGVGMRRSPRLADLILILAALSLVASLRPTEVPQLELGVGLDKSKSDQCKSDRAIWLDQALRLHLERAGQARLQLTLSNDSWAHCWIPGTFCRDGQDPDWWSQGVRVRVEPVVQNEAVLPWRLGPSYGERSLHEHSTDVNVIQPLQSLRWEFALEGLVEAPDGETPHGWAQARGPFLVTCELRQSGHKVVSNTLLVGGEI